MLGREDILLSDVGAHKMWVARHYRCHEPNTCLIPNGFSSMGFALPGAIAASLVHPQRKVLAVCGDDTVATVTKLTNSTPAPGAARSAAAAQNEWVVSMTSCAPRMSSGPSSGQATSMCNMRPVEERGLPMRSPKPTSRSRPSP